MKLRLMNWYVNYLVYMCNSSFREMDIVQTCREVLSESLIQVSWYLTY